MFPASQRLKALDGTGAQTHDRLIVHPELAPGDGAAKVALHAEVLGGTFLHFLMEHRVPPVAGGLGPIHGRVSSTEAIL